MSKGPIDFAFLTDPPDPPSPAVPAVGPLLGYVSARFRPSGWGRVRYRPVAEGIPPTNGAVVLVHDGLPPGRLFSRCLARAKPAQKAGARLLALGGRLVWHGKLAAALGRETGIAVAPGLALEAAALVDTAIVLLRWRGQDPTRARAVVLADLRAPEAAEGVTEYLGERVGRVGVCGLDGLRRLTLADRMRASSGAVLEVFRTVERCLVAADLLVLCGGPVLPDPLAAFGGSGASVPTLRTTVVADLRPGRHAVGPWGGGSVVRLAGPQGAVAGRLALSGGPVNYPLRLGRVLFGAPARWEGRSEPGLPAGLLSAPLVEAVVLASELTRARRRRAPTSRRALDPERMEWLRRKAAFLGFHPAAVAAFGPGPTFLDSSARPPI